MRFAFIHTEKARCTVQALCRALDVSPSGFYAWCRQPESAHAQRDRQLRVLIRASHEASRYRYGSPRVHEDLIEQGVPISRKRVVRLMRAEGLTARVRKRFKCTTMSDHDQPVAANVLGQDFVAEAPNQGVVARIVPGPHDAHRQDPHWPMRYDTGRPSSVIRLRISQPRTTSLPCPAGLRARRPSPMMDL